MNAKTGSPVAVYNNVNIAFSNLKESNSDPD